MVLGPARILPPRARANPSHPGGSAFSHDRSPPRSPAQPPWTALPHQRSILARPNPRSSPPRPTGRDQPNPSVACTGMHERFPPADTRTRPAGPTRACCRRTAPPARPTPTAQLRRPTVLSRHDRTHRPDPTRPDKTNPRLPTHANTYERFPARARRHPSPASPAALAALGRQARRGPCSTIRESAPRPLPRRQRDPRVGSGTHRPAARMAASGSRAAARRCFH